MPPKRIDQLRALRHQHFARPVMHKRSLVLGRRTVSAFIATAFAQDAAAAAKAQWRKVAAQLRATLSKLAALMDEAETIFSSANAGKCGGLPALATPGQRARSLSNSGSLVNRALTNVAS